MPGDEIDGRGLGRSAVFTTQAAKQIFKGHVAVAFDQQPHGIADRTAASTMQAMQLDHTLRPVGEPVLFTKQGRVHPLFLDGNKKRTRGSYLPHGAIWPLGPPPLHNLVIAFPVDCVPALRVNAQAAVVNMLLGASSMRYKPAFDGLRAVEIKPCPPDAAVPSGGRATMKSYSRSILARSLMAGAASLAFVATAPGVGRAETVTVQGDAGAAGADGVNPGDYGMPGGDGESVSANAGSGTAVTFYAGSGATTVSGGQCGGYLCVCEGLGRRDRADHQLQGDGQCRPDRIRPQRGCGRAGHCVDGGRRHHDYNGGQLESHLPGRDVAEQQELLGLLAQRAAYLPLPSPACGRGSRLEPGRVSAYLRNHRNQRCTAAEKERYNRSMTKSDL